MLDKITVISPNMNEIQALVAEMGGNGESQITEGKLLQTLLILLDSLAENCISCLLNSGIQNVILTQGEKGILFGTKNQRLSLPALNVNIVNV